MATATGATGSTDPAATDPAAAPDRPFRLGFWRRCQLRHLGRQDGAIAHPDLRTAQIPVTTDARSTLRAALFVAVSALWESYFVARASRQIVRAEHRTELTARQAEAQAAETAVTAAQQAAPDPDTVQPGPGERAYGRSPEFVLRRRQRVHQRTVDDLTQRLRATQQAVERTERMIARIEAQDDGQRRVTAVQEYGLILAFICERTIYDRALVRRHPLGDELSPTLDRVPPPLSGWARAGFESDPAS